MKHKHKKSLVERLYSDEDKQFWLFQTCGWLGLSVVTFLSITAWSEHIIVAHVGHTLLQSALGVVVSAPLRHVFSRIWDFSLWQRAFISVLMVVNCSAVWTALRLETFMWMSGERGLWNDFGEWYFASLFVFMCWAALYYGIKYYRLQQMEHEQLLQADAKAKQEQVKRYQAEAVAKESLLKMLRYQLNPHFLFNTLNAIKALVVLDEGRKAEDMIQQLSEFLRYSLDNDSVEDVTLEQELEALLLYLNIEKTRFDERLILDFNIEHDTLNALLPGLILQPLIENSLKYAIAPSENGGTIRISSRIEEACLHLDVVDTGPGILPDDLNCGRGIGLSNTVERLRAKYGEDHVFDVTNAEPSGMRVHIVIPLSIHEREAEQEGDGSGNLNA